MTVAQLRDTLHQLSANAPIMILDRDGTPREINLGPSIRRITPEHIEATADCEDFTVGQAVYVLGFGNY